MKNVYIGIEEIKKICPEIKHEEAKKIIKECRSKMEKDGFYVPNAKRLLALKEYVEKYMGVIFTE